MAIDAIIPDRFSSFLFSSRGRALLAVICLASLFQGCDAIAQPALPPGVRGPAAGAATRAVSRYLDLERSLQDAIYAKDGAAARLALADDFEARTPSSPDAVPTDAWLRSEFAHARRTRVRELAVREFEDIAVASFLLQNVKADGSAARGATLFVVDVWRQSTGKLQARYIDQPAHPPVLPDRPSGRY